MRTEDYVHVLILVVLLPIVRTYFTKRRMKKEDREYYEQTRTRYYQDNLWPTGVSDESTLQSDQEGAQTRDEKVGRDE